VSDVVFKSLPAEFPQASPTIVDVPKAPEAIASGVTAKTSNPLLEEYKADHSEPYAHALLKTGTPFSYLPGETQKELESIDKFIDMELSSKHLVKNTASYDQTMMGLINELDLGDTPIGQQIHQLASYAQNMLKLDGLEDIQKTLRSKLKGLRTKRDMDNLVLKSIGKLII